MLGYYFSNWSNPTPSVYRKYIIIYEFDALAIGPIRNVGNTIRTLQYYYRNSQPQYEHVNMYIINDL